MELNRLKIPLNPPLEKGEEKTVHSSGQIARNDKR